MSCPPSAIRLNGANVSAVCCWQTQPILPGGLVRNEWTPLPLPLATSASASRYLCICLSLPLPLPLATSVPASHCLCQFLSLPPPLPLSLFVSTSHYIQTLPLTGCTSPYCSSRQPVWWCQQDPCLLETDQPFPSWLSLAAHSHEVHNGFLLGICPNLMVCHSLTHSLPTGDEESRVNQSYFPQCILLENIFWS